mmetsp:Transcript_18763/g.57709  ORF Transcript_18763/g.57709 Transcript_18763/m.57709 type:complete len:277 (-) Transcript_18763:377-1207(-)
MGVHVHADAAAGVPPARHVEGEGADLEVGVEVGREVGAELVVADHHDHAHRRGEDTAADLVVEEGGGVLPRLDRAVRHRLVERASFVDEGHRLVTRVRRVHRRHRAVVLADALHHFQVGAADRVVGRGPRVDALVDLEMFQFRLVPEHEADAVVVVVVGVELHDKVRVGSATVHRITADAFLRTVGVRGLVHERTAAEVARLPVALARRHAVVLPELERVQRGDVDHFGAHRVLAHVRHGHRDADAAVDARRVRTAVVGRQVVVVGQVGDFQIVKR